MSEKTLQIAKHRQEGVNGWVVTDFTMEQVEGRLEYLENRVKELEQDVKELSEIANIRE